MSFQSHMNTARELKDRNEEVMAMKKQNFYDLKKERFREECVEYGMQKEKVDQILDHKMIAAESLLHMTKQV